MKTFTMPLAAIRPQIAYEIAEGVYRLYDHRLAIADQASNQTLVLEMTGATPTTKKGRTE